MNTHRLSYVDINTQPSRAHTTHAYDSAGPTVVVGGYIIIIRPDQINLLLFGFAGRIFGQTGKKWGSKVEFNAHAQL